MHQNNCNAMNITGLHRQNVIHSLIHIFIYPHIASYRDKNLHYKINCSLQALSSGRCMQDFSSSSLRPWKTNGPARVRLHFESRAGMWACVAGPVSSQLFVAIVSFQERNVCAEDERVKREKRVGAGRETFLMRVTRQWLQKARLRELPQRRLNV